jgi:hypothetical protein
MELTGYIGKGFEESHINPMDITSYQLILMVQWFLSLHLFISKERRYTDGRL